MRLYLDTSALVKIHVEEEGSPLIRDAVVSARLISTSAIAYVEARAAFARRRHTGELPPQDYRRIVKDLDSDWGNYLRVEVTELLIREAARVAERHRLRAYDAIHLASAADLRRRLVEPVVFATWDADLETAARREGLALLVDRRRAR
ncbi:MAG: type II toxin-antitoxin system VapC family toxin [candidate division NC10 bacterium]|nr:type II toxin-antitoxin system VapC family toxin [candidate division NC10 bacterium]